MLSKSIISILSAFMLLQAQALPRMRREAGGVAVESKQAIAIADNSDSDSHSSSSEESADVRKLRQKLMTTTLVDMVGLAKYVTEHGQPVLKKALAQLEALPEKSPALQANITRIADHLKNSPGDIVAAERQGMISLFESTYNFTNIMMDMLQMPADLEQTQTLQKAFTDNGSEKFEDDLMAELKVATRKFDRAIEMYLEALDEKQMKRESKLLDWYTKFRNEKDEEKKAKKYTYFFDTYKP